MSAMTKSATQDLTEASLATTWMVVPRGFFAREYALVREGQVVATLKLAIFKEACEFTLGGHQFEIRRKSIWKDGFDFACDGVPVCTVVHYFLSSRFEIAAADQGWTLKRAGWFSRRHQLLSGEQQVGTIQTTGWFTSQRIAQFADSVPPPIQVLAIFIVLIVARREQQAATS
jgi:hypothetical protein